MFDTVCETERRWSIGDADEANDKDPGLLLIELRFFKCLSLLIAEPLCDSARSYVTLADYVDVYFVCIYSVRAFCHAKVLWVSKHIVYSVEQRNAAAKFC